MEDLWQTPSPSQRCTCRRSTPRSPLAWREMIGESSQKPAFYRDDIDIWSSLDHQNLPSSMFQCLSFKPTIGPWGMVYNVYGCLWHRIYHRNHSSNMFQATYGRTDHANSVWGLPAQAWQENACDSWDDPPSRGQGAAWRLSRFMCLHDMPMMFMANLRY